MGKNEIVGYEPFVDDLKQLIHKKAISGSEINKFGNYKFILGNWRRNL